MYMRQFKGLSPRINSETRQNAFAETADNVVIEGAGIKPWPEACPQCVKDSTPLTIIPNLESCPCFAFSEEIDYVKYPYGECDLYFYIRDGGLRVADEEMLCLGQSCNPSPPCPQAPAQFGDSGGCDLAPFSYVYTYVNQFGFEGPPSSAFLGVLGDTGYVSALVRGFSEPPDGYCITAMRLYRLDTGFQDGNGGIESASDYFLVAELPVGTDSYTDNTSKLSASLPLLTMRAFPPPDGLESVAVLPTGSLAVTKGRTIYISEPPFASPRPHAFPREKDLNTRSKIINIKSTDNSTFVVTEKYPAILSTNTSENGGTYSLREIEQSHPCISKRSLVVEGGAAYYLTTGGLVSLTQGSRSSGPNSMILTGPQWTLSQFSKIVDSRSVAIVYDGKYFFTSPDNGGCVYVFYYGSSGKADSVELTGTTRITFMGRPEHLSISQENVILYEYDGNIWGMDLTKDVCDGGCFECTECSNYVYETSTITESSMRNYGAAKITLDACKGRSVVFSLYDNSCEEERLIYSREVNNCKPFRLPKGYVSDTYKIRLEGCVNINSLHLAASIADLSLSPSGVAP